MEGLERTFSYPNTSHTNYSLSLSTCLWFPSNGCVVPSSYWILRVGADLGTSIISCCLAVSLAVKKNLLILFLIWNIYFVIIEFESHWAICEQGCLFQTAPGLTFFSWPAWRSLEFLLGQKCWMESIKIDGFAECGGLLSLQMFLCWQLSLWNNNSNG